jgi:hypothetical protein
VHQVGSTSNKACGQNFSFLAPNTAELAAPQISSKNRRNMESIGFGPAPNPGKRQRV